MKRPCYVHIFLVAASLFLGGCLFRSTDTPPRQFVLTSIPAPLQSPIGHNPLAIGIRPVMMAPYLLRASIVVRKSPNEIEYLENAAWAEPLNQCFQQALAANLAADLTSDRVYLPPWSHQQVGLIVMISIEQFDVDVQGRGTLIADWRLIAPGNEKALASDRIHLIHVGDASRDTPEAIAAIMSDLVAQLSLELAQHIRECAHSP